jgi:hypothetical protein
MRAPSRQRYPSGASAPDRRPDMLTGAMSGGPGVDTHASFSAARRRACVHRFQDFHRRCVRPSGVKGRLRCISPQPPSPPALATAVASEAGQALAIGAIKIGTRRVYFSQNAEARARAGCCDMPLQTIGGHTYCHTPLHARRGASFGPFVAELRHSDRRGNSAQHPNQGRLSAVSLNALVNSSRAPDDDPTLTDRISL